LAGPAEAAKLHAREGQPIPVYRRPRLIFKRQLKRARQASNDDDDLDVLSLQPPSDCDVMDSDPLNVTPGQISHATQTDNSNSNIEQAMGLLEEALRKLQAC